MPSGRSARLVAGILLLLLIGWVARWWRSRSDAEEYELSPAVGIEESPPAAEIDLPRE